MKKLHFHVFSCEAEVGPAHRDFAPGSRILLLVWVKEADEETAFARALGLAAEQHYRDVHVRSIKHVDAAENNFQGNLATAFQRMLETGWAIIAYPEQAAVRH